MKPITAKSLLSRELVSSQTMQQIAEARKKQLEERLRKYQVRLFDNVHVSGHGGREDLRDFISLTKPKHVIPSHGDLKKTTAGANLSEELGYKLNKTVHLMQDGDSLEIE